MSENKIYSMLNFTDATYDTKKNYMRDVYYEK